MENSYIYLILVAISLFISYKTGILRIALEKLGLLIGKANLGMKEFERQNKLQSKAHKKYRTFVRNDKEI